MSNEPILVTIHYQATWGGGASSGNGGIQGGTDDTLETLKAHLAKYIPGATFVRADCYDASGKYLHSYEAEPEAGEPIRADLLSEAGWVKQEGSGPLDWWYNKNLDEVDENPDPYDDLPYYYLEVHIGRDGGIDVYIAMNPDESRLVPGIETMGRLEGLYKILRGQEGE